MRVYPAVDLMDGCVVRLYKGRAKDCVGYDDLGSPVEIAKMWEEQGAEILHIIDLDRALGRGDNSSLVKNIVHDITIPVQFGGGLRSMDAVSRALNSGIERVIVGTLALREPEIVQRIGNSYGFDRLVVALDYKQGKVVSNGWVSDTNSTPRDLLDQFRRLGVTGFLMTSVARDGTLEGADPQLSEICGADLSDIILAGGVRSLEEISQLASQGIKGVVLGKALYESRISLPMAIQEARRSSQ